MYSKENITTNKIISNIANSIAYPIIVQLNTLMPLTLYVMAGEWNNQVMTIIRVALIIIGLIALYNMLKLSIIFYFFIKEKRKDKLKWYE